MTFDDFVAKYNGQPVETEDPTNPDQCMDLAFAWCDAIGIDRATIRHLYAYQIWTQPQDITLKYFNYIPNTPNGVPQKGDIVVFNQTVGVAGHVAVATGKGDTNGFTSFDQNWSGVQYARIVNHVYTSVFGWLHVKEPITSDPVILSQSDAFIALCTLLNVAANKDLAIAEINKLITIEDQAPAKDKQLQDAQTQIADLQAQFAAKSQTLADAQTQIATLTTEVEKAQKTIDILTAQNKTDQEALQALKNSISQPPSTGWQKIIDGFFELIGRR